MPQNILMILIPLLLFGIITFYFFKNFFIPKPPENSGLSQLRIQAFERMTLFLERIKPSALVLRLNTDSDLTANQFKGLALAEIRNEYGHNAAQQIYISASTWAAIETAVESVQNQINLASGRNLTAEPTSKEIAIQILENADNLAINQALMKLKTEFQKTF